MNQRELRGDDGIAWTCVQAFAGVADHAAREPALQVP